ncbi:hypothetical protein BFW01_g11991 [Lasiodiplodia theobromae]|uniref:Gem-associated protein 5 TPR domain-containing protein n=1 Tax=Lasiodiplodia theobromae TaxID=45133 RepID=A0A5N5DCZ2_9PEZI|nr:hypothetical protein DBV05_g6304 [Lasiodiplodia theobromae]KAF9640185.1 hypothetical protein BFW01_g11991 [Lasiodiplodia theobromae]
MSAGQLRRHRSTSRSSSRRDEQSSFAPPAPSITPKAQEFEPCAATASFFLYAQRNVILCLHHDTLAIERRLALHREDVAWIAVDNVSERGAGRLVVSYDVGNTAIVWDLLTGDEVARFAAYEQINAATFMRNGNVAFGNSQGNVILFEPSTSEHISARTIFDPITALAPAADCRTFAIGYQNGSILIVTLQPTFTILHTLTTPKQPSPIINLAWHGSSSKQKSEMLATQTCDGDLRVWSVPKAPSSDPPCVIRILNRSENRESGPCWFGWSKNGRIVQYSEGATYAWDVRTKKVTYDIIPTIEGVTAIANFGPGAVLFTLGRNHTVQQYDINPNQTPVIVANVQHVPANTPPSPPNSIEEKEQQKHHYHHEEEIEHEHHEPAPALPVYLDESSEGEGAATMSPLQKIAQEMDQLEEERRDRVGPLSPVSSRGSTSSRSSGGSRRNLYRYDKPSSRSSESSDGTVFSSGSSMRSGSSYRARESMSIRSGSSLASSRHRSRGSSSLRKEMLRSPEESTNTSELDLFPFTKARLSDVPFRMPQPGAAKSPDELRQQMLSVVFGWEDDIEMLIRDELSRHSSGSASSVLLSKWLGDNGADLMASMIGSESMTSSDWMLLALCSMGQNSQRKVGEAFVQRLMEKGDIHPAVAILLGLGELNEAVEVYVARKYYLEAVLLTCLLFPHDWQRQSFLVRKWGEVAVTTRQPELAVRCFYCTSMESTEPWSSPKAQDDVYRAQQSQAEAQLSPPLSPPSAGPNRVKQSGLKLFTSFNDHSSSALSAGGDRTAQGITPIAQSALSPGGGNNWLHPGRSAREPSSARTATPGGYGRKRFPSKPDYMRGTPISETPIMGGGETPFPTTAVKEPESIEINFGVEQDSVHSRHPSIEVSTEEPKEAPKDEEPMLLSAVAYTPSDAKKKASDALPSPAHAVFEHLKQESRQRNGSRDRKPDGLYLDVVDTVETSDAPSTASQSGFLTGRNAELSPPLTSNSVKSSKIRGIDQYISSLDEANYHARKASRSRAGSKDRAGRSSRQGARDASQTRGRSGTRYIKPAKRSPSSPVPMSPEEAALYSSGNNSGNNDSYDDERYYKVASPMVASRRGRSRSGTRGTSKVRSSSKLGRRHESTERRSRSRNGHLGSRAASRQASRDGRSNGDERGRLSPTSPVPMSSDPLFYKSDGDDDGAFEIVKSPVRTRQRSSSRRPSGRSRQSSPDRHGRERSQSRRPSQQDITNIRPESPEMTNGRQASRQRMPKLQTDFSSGAAAAAQKILSQKERAARELEERRLSLARRPSAPVIPHPQELSRPPISGRSLTDLGNSPTSFMPPMSSHSDKGLPRSQTVDPEMMRYNPRHTTGTSTRSTPIGLPATPRALRHPRYMSSDPGDRDEVPAVPQIPQHIIEVNIDNHAEVQDDVAPLLPATTFGQAGPQSPQRSASAPPEHINGGRRGSASSRGSGNKRISPPPITASIDETLHGEQIIIVGEPEAKENPPLLAELQHLAAPPPPPPPPMFHGHSRTGSGVINIAIDENPSGRTTTPAVPPPVDYPINDMPPPPPRPHTGSPHMHRRGRGSVSESIGSRLRGVTERMRSTSRSRAKSPPNDYNHAPSPYETVIPGIDFGHNRSNSAYQQQQRAKSPLSESQNFLDQIPPPPPPAPSVGSPMMEQVIPPDSNAPSRQNDRGYMRHPREIRANMPPEQIQAGVVPMESPTGMI